MSHFTKLAAVAIFASGLTFAEQYAGWITDAKCAKLGQYLGDLHKKHVSPESPVVFVYETDLQSYPVVNPDKVKEAIGKKVSLQGKMKDYKIEVEEVTVLEGATGFLLRPVLKPQLDADKR